MSTDTLASARRPLPVHAVLERFAGLAVSERVLAVTLVFGAAIFWLAPRPPMTDLSQHVGQVVLWRDLLLGQSPFADLFRINLLTPYLTGYGAALMLSVVLPPLAAFKVLLSLAFVAFVLSCRQLLRDVGADPRLVYLSIPGFFGFSFDWGFATFLISAPIALQFIRLSLRQSSATTMLGSLGLVGLGTVLLFSHGMLFVFAGLVGGAWLLSHARSWRGFLVGALPYLALAVICLAYFAASRHLEAPAALSEPVWMLDPMFRLAAALFYVQSSTSPFSLPLTLVLIIAPVCMGYAQSARAAVPLAVVAVILMLAPAAAYSTDYIFQRFALFLLPFLALAFIADPVDTLRRKAWIAAMLVACWSSLTVHAARTIAFAIENRDFETVLAAAEPGRRAVAATLVRDTASVAARNHSLAAYQPNWYQVDKHGIVDFNFAIFHPQVVRYRSERIHQGFAFSTRYAEFDWSLPQTRLWDYFFVRRDGPDLPKPLTEKPACTLRLVAEAGRWMLFERTSCQP